ncbi:MAG: lytic transglycosylase domain-containing protein [Deltaproteobacteria bacterium]|nr:lytic transglycosylase domain-containing protein [Deltaproteobacteria bacterium]
MMLIFFALLAMLWLWPGALGADAPLVPPPAPPSEAAHMPYFRLPESLYFCGEAVPLNDPAVRESLDREFTIITWNRAQTTMWLKRGHRYFPEIEQKLRARRLPLDLKYVVIIESDLLMKAKSSAGAQGPWQFMAPTAQRFQLKCNDNIDERLEFSASTDAALQYLQNLYQIFHNWPLALASYNCGEGRVQKEMALQGVNSYYYLSLPEETERYVYRALAAKIVLEDPARYGYDIPAGDLYSPLEYDEVSITLLKHAPVRRLAEACGSYYRAIKTLNPWIKGAALNPGTYRVKLPKGTASRFEEAYRRGQLEVENAVKPEEAKKAKREKKK